MTTGQIFRHSSRFASGLTSPLPAKDVVSARWLLRVLPDFGIVQLDSRRGASISTQFEQLIDMPLARWSSAEPFIAYPERLADILTFPSAEHAYLQHSLRVWAEKGGVLWILVEGDQIPSDQLIQLLRYRPLSRSGQFAIRIILKVADSKWSDISLKPLAGVIHERIGDPPPLRKKSITAYAPYLFIVLLSATSIAATVYVASQKKATLATTVVKNKVEQIPFAVQEGNSVEKRLPVLTPPEVDAVGNDAAKSDSPDSQVEPLSLSEKAEVVALIERWSRAWQQQNVDEYFSMYSHGYSAYRQMSSKEWRLWRTSRLKRPVWISIEIGPVTVERKEREETEVELHATFWQPYRSPGYQDDTLKRLILRQEEGGWKITDEINEEVRPLSQD